MLSQVGLAWGPFDCSALLILGSSDSGLYLLKAQLWQRPFYCPPGAGSSWESPGSTRVSPSQLASLPSPYGPQEDGHWFPACGSSQPSRAPRRDRMGRAWKCLSLRPLAKETKGLAHPPPVSKKYCCEPPRWSFYLLPFSEEGSRVPWLSSRKGNGSPL